MDGVAELAQMPKVDIVLCSIVGSASLRPVLEALEAGKDLALASKEALVMAGSLVKQAAANSGASIFPVDSEHSAIFQCVDGRSMDTVSKIILTASGGAFRDWPSERLVEATLEEALSHPTWAMGPKITIDSATLMNKALEIIEAHWLFDVPYKKIEVLIHRESLIHAMVEFIDGTFLAQMGSPDMRIPIQHALTYPKIEPSAVPRMEISKLTKLSFEKPDEQKYPSLEFARAALNTGGTMPAVMNAANEVAVDAFRCGKIKFTEIWKVIERTMSLHRTVVYPTIEDIMVADAEARKIAKIN